ncbi:hypothetical protein CPB85DRAFT_1012329 [Mucidula mucida]|nr:hypothetical protein CPB85DRAFT_1012329 [Mucidula mucida]
MSTSATTERNLMFAGLQLSDDDGLLGAAVSAELGEIKIEHWHVMIGAHIPYKAGTYAEIGPIHERSKKAVSRRAQLGAVKAVPLQTQRTAIEVAVLTVIYRYRPLDMLQADGIVPPPAQASNSRKRHHTPEEEVINISDEESEDEPNALLNLRSICCTLKCLELLADRQNCSGYGMAPSLARRSRANRW